MASANEAQARLKFAKMYLTGLLPGLHSLHSNGLVHLDLKPDNAMNCSPSCTVTLLDFGCSMRFQEDDKPTKPFVGGTPWYMDLERLCCRSCPPSPSADM